MPKPPFTPAHSKEDLISAAQEIRELYDAEPMDLHRLADHAADLSDRVLAFFGERAENETKNGA